MRAGFGLIRRFVLASTAIAGSAVACDWGDGGDCEETITVPVGVNKACPAPEDVEETVEDDYDHPDIPEQASTELLVPWTICWYRATFPTLACDAFPTRESYVESAMHREDYYAGTGISCDAGVILYPRSLPVQATTRREAAAATPAECPDDLSSQPLEVDGERGQIGELVAVDFIPARVLCHYDVNYICHGGCGTVPMGGLQ